jgi:hypothetical protein
MLKWFCEYFAVRPPFQLCAPAVPVGTELYIEWRQSMCTAEHSD